jgi:hypothetical protein
MKIYIFKKVVVHYDIKRVVVHYDIKRVVVQTMTLKG